MEALHKQVSTWNHPPLATTANRFALDVSQGLSQSSKRLSSVYFYDEQGSQIFEDICNLKEYYLTRKETEILQNFASEIIANLPMNTHLVELGSGSSRKTRLLLEAALNRFEITRYSPIDVSAEILTETAKDLVARYPALQVEIVADLYEVGLKRLLRDDTSADCVMWLGSSIGNLTRLEASEFMGDVRNQLSSDDSFLLGVDLRKSAQILEPAYDDAQGITADFNLNLLARINRELGGRFQLEKFKHEAIFNEQEGRIEMYLISQADQQVWIAGLGQSFTFRKNEKILTEYSYKYSQIEIEALAKSAGYVLENQWLDSDGYYSLNYFKPV